MSNDKSGKIRALQDSYQELMEEAAKKTGFKLERNMCERMANTTAERIQRLQKER